MSTKRTFKPSKVRRAKIYGFRKRQLKGRKVLKKRRAKGRRKLSV